MKNILVFSFFVASLFIANQSCSPKEKTIDQKIELNSKSTETVIVKPGFVHAVYFWLKKDNKQLLDEFIKDGLPELATVPSIQSVSWGPPANTPRDVVDNSYDLAWIVNFDSAADQDKYQVDPLHLKFVDKYKSLFERVQVYDNIVNHYVD